MIDFTSIPKFIIWIGIAAFLLFLFYIGYNYLVYKLSKPFERFLVIDCFYDNGTSVVILTAKENLRNINVTNIEDTDSCKIKVLYKNSMELCKISNNLIGGKVFVKVNFEYDTQSLSAISECRIKERKGLLDLILSK